MCVCACVCVCMYVCVSVCMCVCTCTCVYVCVCSHHVHVMYVLWEGCGLAYVIDYMCIMIQLLMHVFKMHILIM